MQYRTLMVINSNTAATRSARLLEQSSQAQRKSLARLSSGNRIVSPEDDAAGLSQSAKLHNESLRTSAAKANLQNAISFMQTRDGGLQKIQKAFDRMGELSMLALDATKTDTDRANYNTEFTSLFSTVSEIASTSFNGVGLFREFSQVVGSISWAAAKTAAEAAGGHLATLTSAKEQQQMFNDVGATLTNSWIGLTDEAQEGTFKWVTGEAFNFSNWNPGGPDNFGGGVGQDYAYIFNTTTGGWDDDGLGNRSGYILEKGLDITFEIDGNGSDFTFTGDVLPSVSTGSIDTVANAKAALSEVKTAIENIARQRAQTGAALRRLEYHLDEANLTTENLDSTVSRISDTDVALESTSFARQSILLQSGTAMLAQANSLPQAALKLLG
jgi:flagellin